MPHIKGVALCMFRKITFVSKHSYHKVQKYQKYCKINICWIKRNQTEHAHNTKITEQTNGWTFPSDPVWDRILSVALSARRLRSNSQQLTEHSTCTGNFSENLSLLMMGDGESERIGSQFFEEKLTKGMPTAY